MNRLLSLCLAGALLAGALALAFSCSLREGAWRDARKAAYLEERREADARADESHRELHRRMMAGELPLPVFERELAAARARRLAEVAEAKRRHGVR